MGAWFSSFRVRDPNDIHFNLSGLYGHQRLVVHTAQALGSGAYGNVVKATIDGKPCAAKILHQTLASQVNVARFKQEIEIMRQVKHINIVQFLGVVQDSRTNKSILLMELLKESLTSFLEKSSEALPYYVQVNIGHDIALAVAHLHSYNILHRDLSSNNILIATNGRAKVTDFGMSKITESDPSLTHRQSTQCPGTPAYMPPEALSDEPHYSYKIDTFSIGVLLLQIVTKKFPNPTKALVERVDLQTKTKKSYLPVPEIKRRKSDIEKVPVYHGFLPIIKQCLRDISKERPNASQLCQSLGTLKTTEAYHVGHNIPPFELEPGDAAELAKGVGPLTAEELEKLRNHLCPDEGDSAVGETLEDILRYWIEHEAHPTRALLEEKLQAFAKDKPVGEEEKPSLFKRIATAVSESEKQLMQNVEIEDLINACGESEDLGKFHPLLEKTKPGVVHTERLKAAAIEESQESEEAQKTMPSYYTFDKKYPGVRFFGCTPWKHEVTSTGGHVDWMEEIGVEFDIPPGAVPEDRTLELSVWPCSDGPFELPENFRLASPVYLVSPSFEFSKEVTLTLSHYSNLDEGHTAVFLSAPTSPKVTETSKKPVYQFKVLGKGTFNVDCGQISLTHFCLVGGGHRGTTNKYVYSVYRDTEFEDVAIFSAFLDQRVFSLALEDNVKEFRRKLKSLSSKSISLVGDRIELKWLGDMVIPDEVPCQLTQEQLDNTQWFPYPPMIKLEIPSNVEPTKIEIEILGTEEAIKFVLNPKQGRSSRHQSSTTSSTVNPISPTQSVGEDDVFLTPPNSVSHQETSSEPTEITLIRTNLTFIKSTIVSSTTPSWFTDHLFEKAFITRSKAQEIETSGITDEQKASNLLYSVLTKIENETSSIERCRWFEKFVSIFSDDPVYSDLVSRLKLDTPADTGSNSPPTPAPSPPTHLSTTVTEPTVPATDSPRDNLISFCSVA